MQISSNRDDEPVYCCSSCALAAQIPTNDGNLPVSRQLVIALVLGLAYFNQFLFWSLAFGLHYQERVLLAGRFDAVSIAIGIVVAGAFFAVFLSATVDRWTDWIGLAPVIGLAIVAIVSWDKKGLSSAVVWVLVMNTAMVILLSRGLLKKVLTR